jgi:predicted nucleotidyltransferase
LEAKVEKDGVCHGFYSNCTANEYLTNEALEGFEDIHIKGQVVRTMKYADDLELLAEGEKVLQGMIDRLIEIGGRFGMERNVEKVR